MKPYPLSVLTDVTPMLALNPAGPFSTLVQGLSGAIRMSVLPYQQQWVVDVAEAWRPRK